MRPHVKCKVKSLPPSPSSLRLTTVNIFILSFKKLPELAEESNRGKMGTTVTEQQKNLKKKKLPQRIEVYMCACVYTQIF